MQIFNELLNTANGFLYTYWLVFALILCGLYFTIATRFIQVRYLRDVFFVLKERSEKEHISPFGALMISTASRVGIGNIVGVSVAIASGGGEWRAILDVDKRDCRWCKCLCRIHFSPSL